MLFGVVFIPLNYLQANVHLALAECGMVCLAFLIHRGLAVGMSVELAVWCFVLPFLTVLVYALGHAVSTSIFIWTLLIPALSHRLLGVQAGSVVGLFFLVLAGAVLWSRYGLSPSIIEWSWLSDIMLCAAALFVISYGHERELVLADRKLRERADLDSLTRLASRPRFEELFEQACRAARRDDASAPKTGSLLLIDLDFFKRVNDAHGHDVGDRVLEAVSARLLHQCRESDLLGRIGGEELAILMFELEHEDAVRRADRLRRSVSEMAVAVEGHTLGITLSVGVTTFELANNNFTRIFAETDARLYAAKRAGRNRVHSVPVALDKAS